MLSTYFVNEMYFSLVMVSYGIILYVLRDSYILNNKIMHHIDNYKKSTGMQWIFVIQVEVCAGPLYRPVKWQ